VFKECNRLLASSRLARSVAVTSGGIGELPLSRFGNGCAKVRWDPRRNARIIGETAPERRKVATQLFDQSLVFKLKTLRVALQRSQRFIKMRLSATKRSLPLFVRGTLALDRLLLLGKCLDKPLTFGDRNLRGFRAADQIAALHLKCSAS
jgi:hypothetical protein